MQPTPSRAPRPAQFVPRAIEPTDEQRAIQTATENTLIVQANAGAAKTTTLALRMAESWSRGVSPQDCLALTYTGEARQALASALSHLGVPAAVVRQFRIDTFESFAQSVLRPLDGAVVPARPNAEDLKPLVWQAIEQVAGNEDERWRDALQIPTLGDDAAVEEFLKLCLNLKGRMALEMSGHEGAVTPEYAESLGVSYTQLKVFKVYERLRRGGHPDHPVFRGPMDAVHDLACLIRSEGLPPSLVSWPWRARLVMVDEMHDMNQAMHEVLMKLLEGNRFFCGVGDADQVIHSAAGAEPRFLADAIERDSHRRIARYPLTASFRFDAGLAKWVRRFKGKACSSASPHATVLAIHSCAEAGPDSGEARLVADIRAWKAARKKLSSFAVLLRHPHQSVALENALLAAEIPYTPSGLQSYLMRPEILLVRGLLAVAADRFTSMDDATTRRKVVEAFVFFCSVNIQADGHEHLSQGELLQRAVDAVTDNPLILASFFENQVLRGVDAALARRLRAAVQVAQRETGPGMLTKVLDALRMDLLAASVFVEKARREEVRGNLQGLMASAERFSTPAEFFQSLNDAEVRQRQLKSSPGVVLAHLVSVKGLEFDHVALPYLEQGEFPSATGQPWEEDNLFYVGITRARKFLSLYAHRDRPSPFVARLG
ncbi:3'-5' exonuclease [Variovorax terrae]|uniref:DNA 3'-5' helicase n=1 Tax=Variovorax terrae TaxID=2923278 RepID=A0A9X2ANH5_9BURK|nr:ATP-dependent helicase [Variovorax terrae]MCJ0763775.1 ATP-dependent helicase [Variovorax terrae]